MAKKNMMSSSLKHVLGFISQCDVILTCGDELFVGLYYDDELASSPVVLCKGAWDFNYHLIRIAEIAEVPCVDNQLLTRVLYDELEEGDMIPSQYWKPVSVIYSNLDKFKNTSGKSEFNAMLNNDVRRRIYSLENQVYRNIERKYFKNKNICSHLYEGDVVKYFTEEMRIIAEDNNLNYRTRHSTAYRTDEFYLETYLEKHDLNFWQAIFVTQSHKKIYIFSRNFYRVFEFSEADVVLGFVKTLVETWEGILWNDAQKYFEEFEINPRLYEIANNSIKTMIEMNYNQNGYEYGSVFDKTCAIIYLRKKGTPAENEKEIVAPRMYEILITYNEFLRHPDIFKNFIKSPKKCKKWNFWCKEKKYNPKMFNKQFQSIK